MDPAGGRHRPGIRRPDDQTPKKGASSMSDVINLDDQFPERELHFVHNGKAHTIRRPSEDTLIRFQASNNRGAKLIASPDGNSRQLSMDLEKTYESQHLLVGECCYEDGKRNKDGTESPVGPAVVKRWDGRRVKFLFGLICDTYNVKEVDTPEKVDLQIEALQRRKAELAELAVGGNGESLPKGSPAGIAGTTS
jgi:hypothetical protein